MPAFRVWTALLSCLLLPVVAGAGEVSFRNEVMAVLSRSGCNQGTCHGNLNGKGGFRLSFRGEDGRHDFESIARSEGARRVDRFDPANSLLLLKPTMAIPHEGGRRFRPGDREYEILHDWIAAGMPWDDEDSPTLTSLDVAPTEAYLDPKNDSVRLTATATFSDGTRRDVTDFVVYETSNLLATAAGDGTITLSGPGEVTVAVRYLDRQVPVRLVLVPDRPDFVWQGPEPANFVDTLVFAKLKRLKVNPSRLCDDATFLRRATLDLTGLLPTPDEARAFLVDKNPDKRSRLVDDLLSRPQFATYWALKWADLVRAEEKSLDDKGVAVYVDWIRESFAQNKPLDEFARELLTGRGSTYNVPAANFYRAMRDPITRAESVAQLFLGVRLQCAKCHNHPYDRWTQEDYYAWANNFSQIGYEIKENKRRDENDKHEFVGEQIVVVDPKQEPVKHPETGKPLPPRFLDEARTAPDADGDRLEQLAAWMTDDANRRFARTMANRIWAELLGRGIVDPTDDFRMTNPPIHPELLEALTARLVDHEYDLRNLVRTIMTSNVYQFSSETNSTNAGDMLNYSHVLPRRLPAEALIDAMAQVTGATVRFGELPPGTRAAEIAGVRSIHGRRAGTNGEAFLKLFGKPPRLTPCDCERTDETNLAQAFQLLSGELIAEMLADEQNRLSGMAASDRTPEEMVDELYWAALTRSPTDDERATAIEHLTAADDRRQALEDLTWALLNSAEFLLRH